MILKVVCNWNTDFNIFNIFNDIWNIDNKYDLTYGENYTHLMVLNKYNGKINVDKKNVFGFILEPVWSNNWDRNLQNYCNTIFTHCPEKYEFENVKKSIFMPHHLFPKPIHLHEIQYIKDNTKNILNSKFEKNKTLSIIVSSIKHKRYDYVKKLLDSDIDFDMFGQGWEINDSRYKGYIENKIDGIKNYKYTICLENDSADGWITEKFIDAILCETIPIYNGHRSIENYYPNSYEYIDFDDNFIPKIKEIILDVSNRKYNFEGAKENYLNKYNPFELVKNNIS